jgi:hypothetical protein
MDFIPIQRLTNPPEAIGRYGFNNFTKEITEVNISWLTS